MLKLSFLKDIAKKDPAIARLAEISILSALVYILGCIVSGEVFSLQTLIQASMVPFLAYFTKLKRDIEKLDK